ncbi:hypothetical protein MNV49_002467 [Pseudohyphozyma bogoriensis]|nr:hypothetical protein MNV49_002467 [Pseudohyphozyma bogoriensis]
MQLTAGQAAASTTATTRKADDDGLDDAPPAKIAKSAATEQRPSRIERFTSSDGRTLVSRGVWATDGDGEARDDDARDEMDDEEPVKVDWFAAVPQEVVARILQIVEEASLKTLSAAVRKADPRGTGWMSSRDVNDSALRFRTDKARVLSSLMLVNKRFHAILLPKLLRHVDFSGMTYSDYNLSKLKSTVETPLQPAPDSPPSSQPSCTAPVSGVPSKPSPAPAKLGSLVRAYTTGNDENSISYFLHHIMPQTPNLASITFSPARVVKAANFQLLASKAGPSLTSINRLHFPAYDGEDESARLENLLTLFNRAPNLEAFGVQGLSVPELQGRRWLFILKLNSTIKHAASGAKGVGLKSLYFAQGCSIPVSFIRGLQEAAPRLTSLHLKCGVKLLPDPRNQPFNLRAFVAHYGAQLLHLTIVGIENFSCSGNLDDILVLAPNLKTLHIRSDHITYAFFHHLSNIITPPLEQPSCSQMTFEAPASEGGSLSDGDSDEEYAIAVNGEDVKPVIDEKCEKLGEDLFKVEVDPSPLKLDWLAIQYRMPSGEALQAVKQGSVTIPRLRLYPFASNVLQIESKGLSWPSEMGGQRDLLERASWMLSRMIDVELAARVKANIDDEKKRKVVLEVLKKAEAAKMESLAE